MSEVKSFWCHEASNILCVRASDFDRVTAERDALQALLTAAEADCIKGGEHYLRKIADCASLELRVGQLLELLREAHPFTNDVAHDPDVWMKIDAALKPAEGGSVES